MIRRPGAEAEIEEINGIKFKVWVDPTDLEWDGEEALPTGSEGWDIFVEAIAEHNGHFFTGFASLGSVWCTPDHEGDQYLRENIVQIKAEAIQALENEIATIAQGKEVVNAKIRQKAANSWWRSNPNGF